MYVAVYLFLLWAYIHTVFLMARRSVDVEEFETKDSSMSQPMASDISQSVATVANTAINKGVNV